jgi:predicted lipid-binding transport protein (Tim44 family)
MLKKLVLIATLAVAPTVAFAQSNSGAAGGAAGGAAAGAVGGAVVGGPAGAAVGAVGGAAAGALVGGISADHRTEFRTYVHEQKVPSVTYKEKVVVGATLPDTVTYREVPAKFGKTEYRYTVVNNQTVLVEPKTRKIVQIID